MIDRDEQVRREVAHSGRNDPRALIEFRARQSGRTTRMLMEAMEAVLEGKAVYIIVHSMDYGADLKRRYRLPPSIRFETFRSLRDFSFRDMKPSVAAHPNCVVFVDHSAIEVQYAGMLRELHRFDGVFPWEAKGVESDHTRFLALFPHLHTS